MYGEVLMLNNLVQMYFMVQQSQPMWILIDACAVPISVALTLAKPAKKLAYFTPTAKLLGKDVLTSIVGQICINLGYLTLAMYLMYSQPFYRCHEFDSSRIDLRRWWELSDNYEGSLTGLLTGFQIIHAACSFNLGSHFRLGFWKNYVFLIAYRFFMNNVALV
jgi:cation-transporting ATPase 13A3/4/5